ncbi:MAG: Dam family site-specific DNA-(adenine-N6)-methyltransferase [Microbacteriaceae bacterium]|nr:Dam family site-specific DNA-(adenine-N6)-methyltransferase [Microbacteriaceae bacterium]
MSRKSEVHLRLSLMSLNQSLFTDQNDPYEPATPILKWVGGKRALLPEIQKLLAPPAPGRKFYEPFLGGGAVLFSQTGNFQLVGGDANWELINLYEVVKTRPQELVKKLGEFTNEEAFYYEVRDLDRGKGWSRTSPVLRAARVLYLNKTCFNGLYRVNANGQFNTPFGFYTRPKFSNEIEIYKLHRFLTAKTSRRQERVSLTHGSYLELTKLGKTGDSFYFDPPYVPISPTASFTSYQSEGFNFKAQEELRDEAAKLVHKGVKVLLSNSDTEIVRELYKDKKTFKIHTVEISRGIAAKASSRKRITEVLIEGK